MKLFKSFILIALFPVMLLANESLQRKVTKEIHKEITVDTEAKVIIKNQFGNVNITTWDQNKVVIDVLISVEGNSLTKLNEKLNSIEVAFDLNSKLVKAETIIGDCSFFCWFNSGKVNYKINYTVKMPASNQLNLENDYGAIALNSLEGTAKISCDYGKMIIGELLAYDNHLSFDYTSNSSIEYIAGGEINADYSGFEITEAGIIDLSADYTNSFFERVDSLIYKTDYGKLEIEKGRSVHGNGDYLTFRLREITENLTLNNEYGSIRIGYIAPSSQNIAIRGEFTGIQLGIDPTWLFLFDFDLEFANLKSFLDLNYQKQIIESMEKYYEGYYIDPQSKNSLSINSEFGNVKIIPTNKQ